MNTRFVLGFVALAVSCCGLSQQMPQASDSGGGAASPAASGSRGQFRQELLRAVAADEATVQQAEAAHATDEQLGTAYWRLGIAYEGAAEWGRSEAALEHSASLFRRVADGGSKLSTVLNSLAVVHIAMGDVRKSEKEEMEALRLREKSGDRLQLAESWSTLAAVSLKQHKYEKARDFAAKAVAEFTANPKADESDRIAAQYALGIALCSLKDCASSVPVLKQALDDARTHFSAQDLPVGMGEFLLGYAHWKLGDMTSAGREMHDAVTDMNAQLGWGHPTYMGVLALYAKYLHETRNVEAANDVERQIRRAQAVVDVGEIQSGRAVLGFDGLR